MFNKSLLAAALLIAGGTAVNAAEIGVRHSHGTSTRAITQGRFEAETKVREAYAEASAGFSGGYEFSQDWTSTVDETKTPVQADRPEYLNTYESNDYYYGDYTSTTVERPTRFENDSVTTDSYDESKRFGGSAFVRGLVGVRGTNVNEEYSFSGTDTNSFSELSTFSR